MPATHPHPDRPLLGQALNMAGYTCAAVSSFAERHRAYYFMGNFRENVQVTPDMGDEPADMITDAALDWIEKHRDVENWYLHVTYWDPHTDYLQDESWTAKAAASGPAPAWPDQEAIDGHAEVYGARSALDLHYSGGPRKSRVPHNMPDEIRTRADFEHLINGYDGAIHFWDSEFGRLRRTIEEMGLADEVAIVVSSDHGESFGELGLYAEHGLASEPVHRLPMIVHWPGITDQPGVAATRNDALLYNIDYAPTILDLLGTDTAGKMAGQVLRTRRPRRSHRLPALSGVGTWCPHVPAGSPDPGPPLHPHVPSGLLPRGTGVPVQRDRGPRTSQRT